MQFAVKVLFAEGIAHRQGMQWLGPGSPLPTFVDLSSVEGRTQRWRFL